MLGTSRSRGQGAGAATAEAAFAELLGAFLFTLFAFNVQDPIVLALAYAAVSYGFKYVSGGHINPAVSLAGAISGHITWSAGITYIVAQLLGSLSAALIQALLVPGVHLWHVSTGCISPIDELKNFELFGWEIILTTFFVGSFYASTLIRPGHGDASPLASGLSLFVISYLGSVIGVGMTAVNPARIFASTLMFNCGWNVVWLYLLAQFGGAAITSFIVLALYGRGQYYPGEPIRPAGDAESPASPLLASGPVSTEGVGLGHTRADTFAPMGLPLKHGGVFRHSTVL